MSALREAAGDYLAMRRALGFKLTTQGRHLMSFVGYCEARGAGHITTELALTWASQTQRGSRDEVYQSRRLMVVRIFARHLKPLDPATEIPPDDLLPHHYRRIAPYSYSPGEITALMAAAGWLAPPLRAATWQALIRLLAVTGMRKSEACHLDRDHQVAKLARLGTPGPGQPAWAAVMASKRRKTLVVCQPCHQAVHATPVTNAA